MVCLLCLPGGGCVHRRLTIRSNPPGALVYVDNNEIGPTPASVDFTYYGTRNIRLVMDGYETLNDQVTVAAPWYQFFPIDFVAENLVPTEINDQRNLTYRLEPQLIQPTDQLLRRGDELRRASQTSTGVTLPEDGARQVPIAGDSPLIVNPPPGEALPNP